MTPSILRTEVYSQIPARPPNPNVQVLSISRIYVDARSRIRRVNISSGVQDKHSHELDVHKMDQVDITTTICVNIVIPIGEKVKVIFDGDASEIRR